MSDANEARAVDEAIARLDAGEVLDGSFMYEHGLPSPLVARSRVRRVDDAYVHEAWEEEPTVPTTPTALRTRTLDAAGVRSLLASDRPLRSALGLF